MKQVKQNNINTTHHSLLKKEINNKFFLTLSIFALFLILLKQLSFDSKANSGFFALKLAAVLWLNLAACFLTVIYWKNRKLITLTSKEFKYLDALIVIVNAAILVALNLACWNKISQDSSWNILTGLALLIHVLAIIAASFNFDPKSILLKYMSNIKICFLLSVALRLTPLFTEQATLNKDK